MKAYRNAAISAAKGFQLPTNLNQYNYVTVGALLVSDKNLDVKKTVLGTTIPDASLLSNAEFAALTTPAWRYYNNDPAIGKIYGLLYNFYAVKLMADDIAAYNTAHPLGIYQYELLTKADWDAMISTAGGATVAGGKFKSLTLWAAPNTGASDTYGLNMLPGGSSDGGGIFAGLSTKSDLWTATEVDAANANFVRLANINDDTVSLSVTKNRACSVRVKKKINPLMIEEIPNNDVIKIALYGDSIYSSGFVDNEFPDEFGLSQYEQPFRTCQLNGFTKSLYDYLNYNKPKFRLAKHSDWLHSGTSSWIDSHVMPFATEAIEGSTQWDKLLAMTSGTGNVSSIEVTDCDKMFLVFEGGTIGDATETGVVSITVSVNGGEFVNPSTILQGKKNGASYDTAKDTYDTAFTNPETLNAYNKYQALREVIYNGLVTTNTYEFKITRDGAEPNVYLLGCYYSIGQTLLVINQSKPGFSWAGINNNVYPDLVDSGVNFVILEAPMYHDLSGLPFAKALATALINKIKGYNIPITLCSCTPGAVVVTGRPTAILGDENSAAYMPGQNFVKYFNGYTSFTTTDLANTDEAPTWGDTYRAVIGGVNYDLTGNTSTSYLVTTAVKLTAPTNFPAKTAITFPLTLTKISGKESSKSEIIVTAVNDYYTMNEHRLAMADVANTLAIQFLDVYQAFVKLANDNGESIDEDAYDMLESHPLFAYASSFIGDVGYDNLSLPLQMNYLSNCFNLGDGHHLSSGAHPIIFEKIKNGIFANSILK